MQNLRKEDVRVVKSEWKKSKRLSLAKKRASSVIHRKHIKRRSKVAKWGKGAMKKADAQFSLQIRTRDGKCLFPGCKVANLEKLQCSHYHGRAVKSTRFDPDNCITLCWPHHFKSKDLGFEYQKQTKEKHGFDGQYTIFMRKWLGEEEFSKLNARAALHVKQRTAIENYFALHADL